MRPLVFAVCTMSIGALTGCGGPQWLWEKRPVPVQLIGQSDCCNHHSGHRCDGHGCNGRCGDCDRGHHRHKKGSGEYCERYESCERKPAPAPQPVHHERASQGDCEYMLAPIPETRVTLVAPDQQLPTLVFETHDTQDIIVKRHLKRNVTQILVDDPTEEQVQDKRCQEVKIKAPN